MSTIQGNTVAAVAHPYADRFPMLGAEELERLAADIAENGQQHPIILDTDGRILDGRNRWAACEIAGVTPETVLYEGDDPAAFVLSVNVSRRHLTTGQQAMSTALVLVDAGKRENGKWAYGAVPNSEDFHRSSVWKKALASAGAIIDHAPDLADAVVDGALSLDAAYREAEKRRDAERQLMAEEERIAAEEEAAREHLATTAPEYLNKHATARQALAAWEDDNRREAARIRQEKAQREAAEKAKREALTDHFSGITKAVGAIALQGRYENFTDVWGEFDPTYLNPPQLARELTEENLHNAANFIRNLITWKENQ